MRTRPKVIINGDDLGYTPGVNQGIINAYENGILTSTSVLANTLLGSESFDAIPNKSGLEKPHLGIGVHLNLTFGKPCLPKLWQDKNFIRPYKGTDSPKEWQGSAWGKYFSHFQEDSVVKEFIAQVQRVKSIFGEVDHIDSHQGCASYEPILKAYEKIAKELNLPVRLISPLSEKPIYGGEFLVDATYPKEARSKGIKTIDSVDMNYYYSKPNPVDAFCKELAKVKPGELREFMFHPATDDSQGRWRMTDVQILTNQKVMRTIGELNIQLTTYKESAY